MRNFDPSPFRARRERLAQQMQARGGGVALLATAPEQMRNRDSDHPYRHDSHFYYLTGFTEPEALLALVAAADGSARSLLFCRPKDEAREIWDGYRHGPEAACAAFGFDAAFALGELDAQLPELLADLGQLRCEGEREKESQQTGGDSSTPAWNSVHSTTLLQAGRVTHLRAAATRSGSLARRVATK